MRIAQNAEIRIGTSAVMEMSIMKTSIAKITPVIGAWKMAANAEAPPMPINTLICFWLSFNSCPIFEPMEPPVDTEGPSNPTDPPKPTVSALVIIEAKVV